ncbi:transposase [Rubritalea spongiae]|uniref:Transposase n=1 Tax=Rubritalea spongiae TaxID=430797 RepID=A0ABW5E3M6_9BACT
MLNKLNIGLKGYHTLQVQHNHTYTIHVKLQSQLEPLRRSIYKFHDQGLCSKTLAKTEEMGQATVSRIYAQSAVLRFFASMNTPCTKLSAQRFSTTLCDLKNHKIFDVVEGRSNSELETNFTQLKGRDKMRVVCIDLSSPYRRLIRTYFPNARIVVDRFHVVRIIYQHFMQVTRAIAPQLKSYRGCLTAMSKRPERLSSKQKRTLRELFNTYPTLKLIQRRAYGFRNFENYRLRVIAQYG